jgi:hypothetical protein
MVGNPTGYMPSPNTLEGIGNTSRGCPVFGRGTEEHAYLRKSVRHYSVDALRFGIINYHY